MTIFIRRPRPMTITAVYEEVLKFCNARTGFSGYWGQEPYKSNFFHIFRTAYWNGHCGPWAYRKYRAAKRKRKSSKYEDYVITNESIETFLLTNLFQGKARTRDNRQMIDDLTAWWDAWTYALDLCPNGIRRSYVRRRNVLSPPTGN